MIEPLALALGMSFTRIAGALFFAAFFLAALVAVRYHDVDLVRRGFVAGFFAVLVVVAFVGPVMPLPVIEWHKFSDPVPREKSQLQLRVVDADGRELRYDESATLPVDAVYVHRMIDDFVEAPRSEQRETGRLLLERAREYRAGLENPSPTTYLRYPPGTLYGRWSAETVDGYDRFVGLRVYEVTMKTSEDGRHIEDTDEELVLELLYDDAANGDRANASAVGSAADRSASGLDSNPTAEPAAVVAAREIVPFAGFAGVTDR